MKHYLKITFYAACLALVWSACSEDENDKEDNNPVPGQVSFVTTETVSGGANDYITVTIDGYQDVIVDNRLFHTLYINGKNVPAKVVPGSQSGTVVDVTLQVPFAVGSGRIELQEGTEKIQGPMFEYTPRYVRFSFPQSIGASLTRFTDSTVIAWDPLFFDRFNIIEFAGVGDDPNNPSVPAARLLRQSRPLTIPDKSEGMYKMIPNIGMATAPNQDVFFAQRYSIAGSQDIRNELISTASDFEHALYVEGYGTADFNTIIDVEIDSKGIMYTIESGKTFIRKNDTGSISTFAGATTTGHVDGTGAAAQFTRISALAIDKADNLYVADGPYIRKITPAGVVTTLAGSAQAGNVDGKVSEARFSNVTGLFMAADGKLYIADTGNGKIRVLDTAGNVRTLRGTTALLEETAETFHLFADTKGNIYTISPNKTYEMTVSVPENNMLRTQFERTQENGIYAFTLEEQD
ncbi:NHL repeat-containing protein [Parachryseolinea silvisoli]|uniref:hypothetical protein n=1 Tax=Parachryseolinea silvisoli TaxID=2873601 RepID=UPI002265AE45|nr:hypothetical protein [Parachryseolinea silvisoli]MCD9014598.1 hypothetical protein [Parachryseolinea silvisoli]